MKMKNGIANHQGACALMTARMPWLDARLASIVGSNSPKSPRRIIGTTTPTAGQKVTARVDLDRGRYLEWSLANGYQDATSAKHVVSPRTKAPAASDPPAARPVLDRQLGAERMER